MTYAPATLLDLRAYLQPRTGLSAGNLGIVGDTAHAQKGGSYHLGEDQLRADAYSRRTARDQAGLSNAASALDIGNFPKLVPLSRWLVAQARANAPGTSDWREIIYTPDNKRVLRWDRERGFDSVPQPGEADNSHLWHTHISWYRDSEHRPKVAPFRGFFEGDAMSIDVKPDGVIHAYIIRVKSKAVTYGPDEGQRGEIGPRSDGTPWVGNGLGLYVITGIGKRAYRIGQTSEFVLEDAVKAGAVDAVKWERSAAQPAPDPTPQKYAVTVGGKTPDAEGNVTLP